jgi:galactokinase
LNVNPPLHLLAAFQRRYATLSPSWIVQAPERETWVAAIIGTPDVYSIYAADLDEQTRFSWRSAKNKRTLIQRPLPHWARYAAGVIVELGGQGIDVPGIRAVVIGEDTQGPRYNYAFGLVFAALWHEILHKPYTPAGLTELVDKVRRNYVEC